MAVTLEDIAREAGVTQAAVSEIIRSHPNSMRFREETRKRVLEVAQKLNYHPHFFASQIRAENRRIAMLCVDSLSDFFASEVTQAFEAYLTEHGYYVMVSSLTDTFVNNCGSVLGPHGIMALAVVGQSSRARLPDTRLEELAAQNVKIVSIGRQVDSAVISQILYQNSQAVVTILDHLLSRNPRNLWVFGTSSDPKRRLNVAQQYLNGCSGLDHMAVSMGDRPDNQSAEVFANAIKQHGVPDAVFTTTDSLAYGAIKALEEMGARVGCDVAVAGFNDDHFAGLCRPGLTTMRIPAAQLGQAGAEELLNAYEGRTQPGKVVNLQTELVVRGSCQLTSDARNL